MKWQGEVNEGVLKIETRGGFGTGAGWALYELLVGLMIWRDGVQ